MLGHKNLEKIVAEKTSELIQLNERLQHQAYHDPLTNLPNRLLFEDRLNITMAHSKRFNSCFALLFFDLDHFKIINDTFGHDIGDSLLIEVTKRLQGVLREEDTLARIGGDEFGLLVNDLEDEEVIEVIAKKIKTVFVKPFICELHQLKITTSIGISVYPKDATKIELLKQYADTAMYCAKRTGRDDYRFFTESMGKKVHQMLEQRVLLKTNLRQAVENGELQIYYHPQVDAQRKVVALEALMRWHDNENTSISPGKFIPIAEEMGLIQPLEEWFFSKICQQYADWKEQNIFVDRLVINISGYRLRQNNLFSFVKGILKRMSLTPDFLSFEITENSLMQHIEQSEKVLFQLNELGIEIIVNQFGKGYTSLYYLHQLPINAFKIDASFILQLSPNNVNSPMVNAIIQLAHNLHKKAIAVGVEKEEQFRYLVELQCDYMQGYLFTKPVREEELVKILSMSQFLDFQNTPVSSCRSG